jgi:hypothetical protein
MQGNEAPGLPGGDGGAHAGGSSRKKKESGRFFEKKLRKKLPLLVSVTPPRHSERSEATQNRTTHP